MKPLALASLLAILLALPVAPARAQTVDASGLSASVAHWSSAYGVSAGCEWAIIDQESGGDPQAVNPQSGASGEAQWTPDGIWTTSEYAAEGIGPLELSMDEQIRVLSEELADYGAGAWSWPRGC